MEAKRGQVETQAAAPYRYVIGGAMLSELAKVAGDGSLGYVFLQRRGDFDTLAWATDGRLAAVCEIACPVDGDGLPSVNGAGVEMDEGDAPVAVPTAGLHKLSVKTKGTLGVSGYEMKPDGSELMGETQLRIGIDGQQLANAEVRLAADGDAKVPGLPATVTELRTGAELVGYIYIDRLKSLVTALSGLAKNTGEKARISRSAAGNTIIIEVMGARGMVRGLVALPATEEAANITAADEARERETE